MITASWSQGVKYWPAQRQHHLSFALTISLTKRTAFRNHNNRQQHERTTETLTAKPYLSAQTPHHSQEEHVQHLIEQFTPKQPPKTTPILSLPRPIKVARCIDH